MKFNFDDYGESYVMHCETQEAADTFLSYLHSIGKCWRSGDAYVRNTFWTQYEDRTCYNFCNGTYGSLGFFQDKGCRILIFYDFDWDLKDTVSFEYSFDQLLEEDA